MMMNGDKHILRQADESGRPDPQDERSDGRIRCRGAQAYNRFRTMIHFRFQPWPMLRFHVAMAFVIVAFPWAPI
jgi:hypothetical protein